MVERHAEPRVAPLRHDERDAPTFFSEAPLTSVGAIELGAAAAHHARVKRMNPGDHVRVVDGAGHVAAGSIERMARDRIRVSLHPEVRFIAAPPALHLRVPIADRDRMLWLAEKATELGVTTWQPVRFRRSASVSPRGEGEAFDRRVAARMTAALEQSGGAWLPQRLPRVNLEALIAQSERHANRLLLDESGAPLLEVAPRAPGAEPLLLFGPEGGLDEAERSSLIGAGWQPVKLAEATLRFETAGIAAIAVVRALQLAGGG